MRQNRAALRRKWQRWKDKKALHCLASFVDCSGVFPYAVPYSLFCVFYTVAPVSRRLRRSFYTRHSVSEKCRMRRQRYLQDADSALSVAVDFALPVFWYRSFLRTEQSTLYLLRALRGTSFLSFCFLIICAGTAQTHTVTNGKRTKAARFHQKEGARYSCFEKVRLASQVFFSCVFYTEKGRSISKGFCNKTTRRKSIIRNFKFTSQALRN